MARTSKNIEYIKDKIGKVFIKTNSIVTDNNISLDKCITILFDGDTTSDFALSDNFQNYDYIEVIWRPHHTLGQCSDKMVPSKTNKMHLQRTQTINGVNTIYRCEVTFSGKNVTLNGYSQVINGGNAAGVEEHILRVIGYKF